jgi:hypothetical protein
MQYLPFATSLLFVSLSATSCTTSEPSYGDEDQDLSGDEVEVELPVAPNVEHRLLATAANLHTLRFGCVGGDDDNELDWSCSDGNDGANADFTHKRKVGSNQTEVADDGDNYWGQCVSLVKAAAKSTVVTADWKPGLGVFAGLARGTAIATFPGGHYDGHTAILLGYVEQDGKVIGMRVGDQNWGAMVVRRHVIYREGSGVLNADNYNAVLVP